MQVLGCAKMGYVRDISESSYSTALSVANPNNDLPLFLFLKTRTGDTSGFRAVSHVGKKVGDRTEARGDESPVPGAGDGRMLHDDVLLHWDHHCAILH